MRKTEKTVTFLGKDTNFEGKLRFRGSIRIDGHFKGEITADGDLVVGEEGFVEANIRVSHIVIKGEIHGNIHAHQRVDIRVPGKVFGNIQAPAVVMDDGVIFEGQTRMYQARITNGTDLSVVDTDQDPDSLPLSLTAVYGTVSDQKTGTPIKNADVFCKGLDNKSTKTNSSGYYELSNFKEGQWKLRIKAKGYKNAVAKVDIAGEGTHVQNFELQSNR